MTDLVLVSANAVSVSLDAFISALVGARPPDQTLHGVGYSGCVGIDVYNLPGEIRLNVARPAHLKPVRLYARAVALIGFIDPGEPLTPLADRMSEVWRYGAIPSAIVCVTTGPMPATDALVVSGADAALVPGAATQIAPGDSVAARRIVADLLASGDNRDTDFCV